MRPAGTSLSAWHKTPASQRAEIERVQAFRAARRGYRLEEVALEIGVSDVRLDFLMRTDTEFLWGLCMKIGIDPAPEAMRLGAEL